jgi:hypothetical protein
MSSQTPEEKLHFIESKLDKILTYMFGDISLDKNAEGFATQIKHEIKQAKDELMYELEDVRRGIDNDRREVTKLRGKIDEIEKKQIKYNVQTAIMWLALGGAAALIMEYVLQSWTKPPNVSSHGVIFSTIKSFVSLLKILLWIPK